MDRRLALFLGVIPAAAIVWSSVFALSLYGLGSPWLRLYQVSDFFNLALRLLPQTMLMVLIGMAGSAFAKPARGLSHQDEADLAPDKAKLWTSSKRNGFRAFGWVLGLFSVLFSQWWIIGVFILLGTHMDHLIRLMNHVSGGRLESFLLQRPAIGLNALIFLMLFLTLTFYNVQGLKSEMASFDRSEAPCDTATCVGEYLFVERISAGTVAYSDGSLVLLNESLEPIVTSRFDPGSGRPIACRVVPLEFIRSAPACER